MIKKTHSTLNNCNKQGVTEKQKTAAQHIKAVTTGWSRRKPNHSQKKTQELKDKNSIKPVQTSKVNIQRDLMG